MKSHHRYLTHRAFTLVEMLVAMGVSGVVGLMVTTFLSGSSLLFAKNISTNLTHNSLRSSIDKITQGITQGCSAITLITPAGGTVASTTPAAGVRFDEYIGGPYVVTHPGGTGLTASATSVTITRYASSNAPIPAAGDVLLLDGSTTRLIVSSVSAGSISPAPANLQTLTVSLSTAIGTAIPWLAGRVKQAHLVRRQAYVVVPVNSRNELRFFNSAEAITNFSTASNYALVVKNVGIDSGDSTPFVMSTLDGMDFLQLTLRVRSDQYGNRLANKEANKFSSIQRVQCLLNPRGQ